jgi:hypothetical protein
MPRVLEAFVNALQGIFMDPGKLDGRFRVTLGVGRFLDPNNTSPILLALLGRLDVFTIWVTVLLAIGLSVTGGITRARAFLVAPLIWLAGAIPLVLQAYAARQETSVRAHAMIPLVLTAVLAREVFAAQIDSP